jgi:hypothetical protein
VGAFSVNVPAEEGVLARVPVAEIEALFGPGSEALQGQWDEPQKLQWVFLLALLVLLAAETLLGNLFYRREPQPEGE